MSEKMITVIYYFVSGKKIKVPYTEKNWEQTLKFLCNSKWIGVHVSENFGINYSLVTHYQVKS